MGCLWIVAEVPFFDRGGGVAGGAEMIGERVFVWMDALFALWEKDVLFEAHPFRVATGQQRGSRRRAYGRRHHEVGETFPLGGKAVEVGGLDFLRAVAGKVVVAHVVGENQDHVRLLGGDGCRSRGVPLIPTKKIIAA